MNSIVVILQGGLGNQLFQYAIARGIAIRNNMSIKLDVSRFKKDFYKRSYHLKHFNIVEQFASPWQSHMVTLRSIASKLKISFNRYYIREEFSHFDPKILELKVSNSIYLDGYWQSEKYFKDIEDIIRQEFKIITPHDFINKEIADKITSTNSICVHVRRLHGVPNIPNAAPLSDKDPRANVVDLSYYNKAVKKIADVVTDPYFFVFSDYMQWAKENLKLEYPHTFITKNNGEDKSYEDLWLMSLCKHHVIANSTFSWWGAWLNSNPNKVVIVPSNIVLFNNNKDIIPDAWEKV